MPPDLDPDVEEVVGRVLAEIAERTAAGEPVDLDSYVSAHPEHAESIRLGLQGLAQLVDLSPAGPREGKDAPRTAPDGPVSGYRVIRPLGAGGMANVYLAEQRSVKRLVALKVLLPAISEDRDVITRFHREAVTLGMLSHPNIAAVYASGVENGVHYLAMQYCEGESLQRLLQERESEPGPGACGGSIPGSTGGENGEWARFVLEAAVKVAEALAYAHANGVLHRDVKPSNIIVDIGSGGVWVVDFGLAKVLDSGEVSLTGGGLLGTPRYSSPEQSAGRKVDARSEVYSLGATLRRLLTLPPVDGDAAPEWAHGVGEDLRLVLERATEPEPELRYDSMERLRRDLLAVRNGVPPEIRKGQALRRLWLRLKRRRAAVAASVLFLLLLMTVAAALLKQRHDARWLAYKEKVEGAVMKLELGRMMRKAEMGDGERVVESGFLYVEDFDESTEHGLLDPLQAAVEDLREAALSQPGRPDAFYHRARGLLLLERRDEAMEALQEALLCDERFLPARLFRAELLAERGDLEAAAAERERAGKTRAIPGSWTSWRRSRQPGRDGGKMPRQPSRGLQPRRRPTGSAISGRSLKPT